MYGGASPDTTSFSKREGADDLIISTDSADSKTDVNSFSDIVSYVHSTPGTSMDRRADSQDTIQTFLVVIPLHIIKLFTSYQAILSGSVLYACLSGIKTY